MTAIVLVGIAFLFTGCNDVSSTPPHESVLINEFMALNDSSNVDDFGDYDDWVEIYNSSGDSVSLSGFKLTDNPDNPNKYFFPDTLVMAPYDYLLIWTDGEPAEGVLHANFRLSASGEEIGLYNANGDQIDAVTFGVQSSDLSMGRSPDGGEAWLYYGDCSNCTTSDCDSSCIGLPPSPGHPNGIGP